MFYSKYSRVRAYVDGFLTSDYHITLIKIIIIFNLIKSQIFTIEITKVNNFLLKLLNYFKEIIILININVLPKLQ